MIINITKKLQDYLKIKTLEKSEEVGIDIWYANIFMVGRKKGLLITHSETFYSVFIYGVTLSTFKNLENILKSHLQRQLASDMFAEDDINRIIDSIADVRFMKSTNRAVLANMTQQTYIISSYHVNDGDDYILAHKVNRMPVKTLDYKYSVDVLKEYVENTNQCAIVNQNKLKSQKEVIFIKLECVNPFHGHYSYKNVELLADMSLAKLCPTILKIFGFYNDHLHQFYLSKNGNPYEKDNIYFVETDDFEIDWAKHKSFEKKTLLKNAFGKDATYFLCMQFDFGDDWVFKISEYKKKVTFDPKKKYPFIVKEMGVNPVQYPDFEDEYEEENENLDNVIDFKNV